MKKSIIALAVAGAMTAPMVAQADATLYGSFRIGVTAVKDADADVSDLSSRVGIKGDVDLGLEDTKGLFHWEANINTADSDTYGQMFGKRLGYAGAKGDWGMAAIGRQYHPHYLLINAPLGIFNPGSGSYGERFFLGNSNHKRVDNTLTYASPNLSGFQFFVAAVVDGSGDDADEDLDGHNVAAKYSVNGLTLAASIATTEADSGDESDVWGVSVKYKINALEMMARYEDREDDSLSFDGMTLADADQDVWEAGVRYTVGTTSFYGRFSDYELSSDLVDGDLQQWGIGVQHKMGHGMVFLEHVNNDSEDVLATDRTVAGYRVDF
ncbi:porin [Neptuniibacter sp. CAU 1671]|uniref:porin n=1 Tax=Neptuniibacter sp. CAU 1671 TaxID=3032593 RepID=UPI0023DA0A2C|nr:porin [Neptuniibacter sp. CAU 1671]MDF2181975.1 porin [Neptuniibacter sp. CAU 1671]